MPLYKHSSTNEVREIAQEIVDAWIAAGNPKALVWESYTPPPPAETPPPVPYEVSRRQFFLAVYQAFNLTRAQLRAMMPNEAALIDFDEAAQFKRSYPVLVQLAGQMQPPVTSEQLDDLFRLAATFD